MPCNWPVDRTGFPALPASSATDYAARFAAQNAAEDLAIQVLWSLSGRQFGVCETLARPCPNKINYPWRMPYFSSYGAFGSDFPYGSVYDETSPYISIYDSASGGWVNFSCGCVGRCRQAGPRTAHLPGPVQGIVTVTIGSTVLASSEYSLEGTVLFRKEKNWPIQDYNLPLGEDNTWSVKYLKGVPVPDGVGFFVGQLAKEFMAAATGDACRLPRNVVATTSRGISRQFDPSRIYAAGKTGLTEIDLWLSSINPYHAMQAPKVL
jgi:hypothetical protein